MISNIKECLQNLPIHPGVYQMMGVGGEILYVGKARDLKKRVSSYFHAMSRDTKTTQLINQVIDIKVTITSSEGEALLLENNLIKTLKPRYNILLKDDKSYPYLLLSDHRYPRLDFHRGVKKTKGHYFGPYPSTSAVRETLGLLQKLFMLRQCPDHFFNIRTRPCIQYQIKRCTAPCVNYITEQDYQTRVDLAVKFLDGKSTLIIDELTERMECASEKLEFEQATRYRDLIKKLRQMQQEQVINTKEGNIDVIAAIGVENKICIHALYIRHGQIIGTRSYFPKIPEGAKCTEALAAFIPQYYLNPVRSEVVPNSILVNEELPEVAGLSTLLSRQLNKKIRIAHRVRGQNQQRLLMAVKNAKHALAVRVANSTSFYGKLRAFQQAFHLVSLPQRLECFDISHTAGEAAVGACVVFGEEGPLKQNYRRFRIESIMPGDDYAALRQALERHYISLKKREKRLPDVLIIDGGKGQLTQAAVVLEELQISGVLLISIAKGEGRKPRFDKIFCQGNEQPMDLSSHPLAVQLIQQIRDEAHRFAIIGHRAQRAKVRHTSSLENISGVGAKRRRKLLRYFGGLQEVMKASVADIARVPGISQALANQIYNSLH